MTRASAMDVEALEAEFVELVARLAKQVGIPGVSAGIHHRGRRIYCHHGVTSIENPLPVDASTLFQVGSNTKTFTATALMRLAENGRVRIADRVSRYLPELRLRDEETAAKVTVQQLLNHTAGWSGDFFADTGQGDDALARYVERMEEPLQEFPLGTRTSYNNAAFSLAGRVIEKVSGMVFEDAVRSLILDPLDLEHSFFPSEDVMARRFATGHFAFGTGVETARRWLLPRSLNAAGTLCSTPADMLRYARFQMGEAALVRQSGMKLETLRRMRRVTALYPGSAVGDAVGLSWLITQVGRHTMVGHGGGTNGQISAFQTVPTEDFAFVSLTNSSRGAELNDELLDWSLRRFLGLRRSAPRRVRLSQDQLAELSGTYRSQGQTVRLAPRGDRLRVTARLTAEGLERSHAFSGPQGEKLLPPPFDVDVLAGGRLCLSGQPKRVLGGFVRDGRAVVGVNLGARLLLKRR